MPPSTEFHSTDSSVSSLPPTTNTLPQHGRRALEKFLATKCQQMSKSNRRQTANSGADSGRMRMHPSSNVSVAGRLTSAHIHNVQCSCAKLHCHECIQLSGVFTSWTSTTYRGRALPLDPTVALPQTSSSPTNNFWVCLWANCKWNDIRRSCRNWRT